MCAYRILFTGKVLSELKQVMFKKQSEQIILLF